ncbi:uncharacterized protein RJT21DRAFT_117677 [Scheffersomyces amazonensis]|uniref:uncharacterized protein n=1 Tax=Scheffersomyces amazonensis TaxID=1078765 RepID=UPI00315C7685
MSDKELITWLEDMNSVKGFISQLQATFNQILAKTPSIEEFRELANKLRNDDPEFRRFSEKLKTLMVSPHIKVAVRLKQLYDFNQLVLLQLLLKINFKQNTGPTDRYVNFFIDYVPAKDDDDEIAEILKKDTEEGNKSFLEDERQIGLLPYPPTLPVISSDVLLIRIHTDKSYRQPSDFLESDSNAKDYNQSHNGKLAIRGRSVLELALLDLLEESCPKLGEEELLLFRYELLSPQVLTKFAFGYHLADHLKYNLSKEIDMDSKLEMFSRLFLAYVGAVSIDNYSPFYVRLWIKKLYAPIMQEMNSNLATKARTDIALGKLQLLFTEITNFTEFPSQYANLKFVQVQSNPYVAQVLVNNVSITTGTSNESFEEAKLNAANEIFSSEQHRATITRILLSTNLSDPDNIVNNDDKKEENTDPYDPYDNIEIIKPFTQEQQDEYYRTNSKSPHLAHELPVFKPVSLSTHSPPLSTASISSSSIVPHAQLYGRGSSPGLSPTFGTPQPYVAPIAYSPPYTTLDGKVDKDAKNTLYALLGRIKLQPEYQYDVIPNGCKATVWTNATSRGLQNLKLGVGFESNKKLASQKAAMDALNNRSALEALGLGQSF